MRKILMGVALAAAMAMAGPPLQAQQLDRLTVERIAPPAPSAIAPEDQGTQVNTVYRLEQLEVLPLMTAEKSAGKKRAADGDSKTERKRDQRAAVPSYHLRL